MMQGLPFGRRLSRVDGAERHTCSHHDPLCGGCRLWGLFWFRDTCSGVCRAGNPRRKARLAAAPKRKHVPKKLNVTHARGFAPDANKPVRRWAVIDGSGKSRDLGIRNHQISYDNIRNAHAHAHP